MPDLTPLDTIEVINYDPSWADKSAFYAEKLRSALGNLVMSIEHVGSTSVQGLAAKPIIDMDAYGEAKSEFIGSIIAKAEASYGFHAFLLT